MKEVLFKITKWSPNEIILSTKGKPGNLILSEINYPGWKVWIDEYLSQIKPASTIFRSVYLEGGSHEIIFRFLPAPFLIGCILSLLGWGTMIFTEVNILLIQKKLLDANAKQY